MRFLTILILFLLSACSQRNDLKHRKALCLTDHELFRAFCIQAEKDDQIFEGFRSSPIYHYSLENMAFGQGPRPTGTATSTPTTLSSRCSPATRAPPTPRSPRSTGWRPSTPRTPPPTWWCATRSRARGRSCGGTARGEQARRPPRARTRRGSLRRRTCRHAAPACEDA